MAEQDLADLDAFAAVACHRSFRGAATMREVSASTLSERSAPEPLFDASCR